jgi:hypothetical protein
MKIDEQLAFHKKLLQYVQHSYRCAYLQPMWHQGPCDCGLHDLLAGLADLRLVAELKEHTNEHLTAGVKWLSKVKL